MGGRVGVFARDTGSGRTVSHRADERFAMCSTFKWALVAAVLAEVDAGRLGLAQRVPFSERDLLEYAPTTRAQLGVGAMTVEALCEAAVRVSDNTAANLLLPLVGGPPGVTRFLRRLGDGVTRLDRTEPALNTNLPGDARDTTSPKAMAGALQEALLGSALSAASRARLRGLLVASTTGRDRLCAGLPPGWVAGDKTGTGERSAVNDVAIVWPPGRAPLVIAAYLSDGASPLVELKRAHVAIARYVVEQLR